MSKGGLSCYVYTMKQRCLTLFMIALCLLTACMPTPMKVNDAIGRGQLTEAVDMLSYMLNNGGEISTRKLENILRALTLSRHFNLDLADQLFDQLNTDSKKAILRWYIETYLEETEKLLQKASLKEKRFEEARRIWRRHQKVRQLSFPEFQEATPVMGVIALREAEYWANLGQKKRARQSFAEARKLLTQKQPFDRVQQYAFQNMVQDIQRKLQ